MNFINIPKNIPKRKYLVIDESESSWSSKRQRGIHEIQVDGQFVMHSSINECVRYTPIEVSQLVNKELNDLGVHHLLHVIKTLDASGGERGVSEYLGSEEYKIYLRDNEIDKVLNKE